MEIQGAGKVSHKCLSGNVIYSLMAAITPFLSDLMFCIIFLTCKGLRQPEKSPLFPRRSLDSTYSQEVFLENKTGGRVGGCSPELCFGVYSLVRERKKTKVNGDEREHSGESGKEQTKLFAFSPMDVWD